MAAAYLTEVHERHYHDKTIIVENVKPTYRWDEQEAIKKSIEEQLYDVFCKYASN